MALLRAPLLDGRIRRPAWPSVYAIARLRYPQSCMVICVRHCRLNEQSGMALRAAGTLNDISKREDRVRPACLAGTQLGSTERQSMKPFLRLLDSFPWPVAAPTLIAASPSTALSVLHGSIATA